MIESEKRFQAEPGHGGLERALRVVRPGRLELSRLGQRHGLEDALLRQLQDTSLSVGFVEFPGQLLVRVDLPEPEVEKELRWLRLDVVLGDRVALILEPRELGQIGRALARFEARGGPARGDGLLAALLEGTVDAFEGAEAELQREFDALLEAGMVTGKAGPLESVREQLGGLKRGAQALRELLAGLTRREVPPVGELARAELRASHDRLATVSARCESTLEKIERSVTEAEQQDIEVGAGSPEIIEAAAHLGQRRLRRITLAHAMTALIGGMAVSFGAMAMAWTAGPWHSLGPEKAHLLAALVFPIGFVILIVGKGELFTENFFVPVTGVMTGRGTVRELLSLWGSTLAFNLVGVAAFGFLASRPEVLDGSARDFLISLAVEKTSETFWVSFTKAIFAGWLMTVLTWLLLAAKGSSGRLFIIWTVGFLIVAGHFNHVVISASEILLAMMLGGPITIGRWLTGNFVPALLGNLVGGVVFVTLLGYVQAHSLRQGEERLRQNAHQR